MALLSVNLHTLLALAAISVSAEASRIFGETQAGSKTLYRVSGSTMLGSATIVTFNANKKFNIAIDKVDAYYAEDCASSSITGGGIGQSQIKLTLLPRPNCANRQFSIEVNGRVLGGKRPKLNEDCFFYPVDINPKA